MISVKKSRPLKIFEDFVLHEKPTDWEEVHRTKNFQNLYREIRKKIAEEQNGISAYTEEPFSEQIHIDHFYKRSLFPERTFDWNNLFVDGVNENYGAKYKDAHIKKCAEYDNLISPGEENVERFFSYMSNGEVIAAKELSARESQRAEFTIKTFNLNDSVLKSKRARIIGMIGDYKKTLSPKDIKDALANCGFKTVVEYATQF